MICQDFVTEYIRNTIKKDEGFLLKLRDYAQEFNIPIVQPETARLLEVLCHISRPRRVLEIGTALGYSAILMAHALGDEGSIDTIDRSYDMTEKAKYNIRQAELEKRINVITGDALDVLKCLEKKYDFIFLDASKGHYLELLPDILRLLQTGGVLVSDNVLYKGMIASDDLVIRRKNTIVRRMRDYLDAICSSRILSTSIIPIGDGVAISCKISD
ncbi:MAG TPA: O-methyltransferase [Clostridiaceae bacterium]|nr:O-methyltransferase [Clostridiaceae bacterium]